MCAPAERMHTRGRAHACCAGTHVHARARAHWLTRGALPAGGRHTLTSLKRLSSSSASFASSAPMAASAEALRSACD